MLLRLKREIPSRAFPRRCTTTQELPAIPSNEGEANNRVVNRAVNVVTSSWCRSVGWCFRGASKGKSFRSFTGSSIRNCVGVLVQGCFGGTKDATNGFSPSCHHPQSNSRGGHRDPSSLIGAPTDGEKLCLALPAQSTACCWRCRRRASPRRAARSQPTRPIDWLGQNSATSFPAKKRKTSEVG